MVCERDMCMQCIYAYVCALGWASIIPDKANEQLQSESNDVYG